MVFVTFNTSCGKPKPVTIRALLDSGASASLILKKFARKLKLKTSKSNTTWTTAAGDLTTNSKCKAQFCIPELEDKVLLEYDLNVTDTLVGYDMIIGRDILEDLGVVIDFNQKVSIWGHQECPFKSTDATVETSYFVEEPEAVQHATDRIKKILDANYEKADPHEIAAAQDHLTPEQQEQLEQLLHKYESLTDGTLGQWVGDPYEIQLKPGAKPYHAKAFPVPRVHLDVFKREIERYVKLGVLKKVNRSEWAAPCYLIPKTDQTAHFINDFRELNKRIVRKPYPIPQIQDMLLNLEGFQYATSLDLNMGYYHIELSPNSKKLCTLVTPFGKYEMQKLPMGLCNSPDIFQEKVSILMEGLEFVRAYIDDLLVLSKGSFEDHLLKLELVLQCLQKAGLKVNAKKSFFARPELEYLGYVINRDGMKPSRKKVEAIQNIAEPKTRKQLRGFIGLVNYYCDMWIRRSHVLAPLSELCSKNVTWKWTEAHRKAFNEAKKIVHPGETRTELTIAHHYTWKGMRKTVQHVCSRCDSCQHNKRRHPKLGKLNPKDPEVVPWQTVCIDLIGPYPIGEIKKDKKGKVVSDTLTTLHAMTMVDPATGWFEIIEVPNKRADYIANLFEQVWLARYPWPAKVVMDRGREFMGEVIDLLRNNGIVRWPITTRNPQANAMVERAHQTIHNMIRTQNLRSKHDLPDGWIGVLTAVALGMRATIHTTNRASPTQLVFGRDHFLNVNFEANWQYIKHRKQRMIVQNNKRKNAKRAPHQYNIGDKVLVLADPNRKHGEDEYLPAPHTVTHVYGNNTLRLRHETPSGGAKYQTWNLRQVKPYKD
jgi:hypothetical protein